MTTLPKEREEKELTPNVRYVTQDGYKYTTDDLGRIVDVEADKLILKEADRNLGMQRVAGREDRLPDDDGGHLIGTQFMVLWILIISLLRIAKLIVQVESGIKWRRNGQPH